MVAGVVVDKVGVVVRGCSWWWWYVVVVVVLLLLMLLLRLGAVVWGIGCCIR